MTATDEQLLTRIADTIDPMPASVTADALAARAARPIRALTVKQPFAAFIASGQKLVENRTWATRYRGLLAIHAGLAGDPAGFRHPAVTDAAYGAGAVSFRRGAILARAELTDCHQCDGACSPWAEPGTWHWVLTDIRALPEPVACKGRLSLWTPDVEIRRAVLDQLTEVAP